MRILLLISFLLLPLLAPAQAGPARAKLLPGVDALAKSYLKSPANCGLSIGIIIGDRVEQFFYGSTRKEAAHLPDSKTLYEIGSITKTVTGILLAHAINEGKMSADDDIRKYLPRQYANLQYKGQPILVKHLANHTARLPEAPADIEQQPGFDAEDPLRSYPKEKILNYLRVVNIDTTPGTVSAYSNLGVAVLGILLEEVYHRPYEELVRSVITGPLGMADTRFTPLAPDLLQRMATGYRGKDGLPAAYWHLNAFNAAGGLVSDLDDLLLYLRWNMQEKNKDVQLAHRLTHKEGMMGLGLNWMITDTKEGQTMIWHNGHTYGFTSFCGYIKETNIGVVVLSNSGNSVNEIAVSILKDLSVN